MPERNTRKHQGMRRGNKVCFPHPRNKQTADSRFATTLYPRPPSTRAEQKHTIQVVRTRRSCIKGKQGRGRGRRPEEGAQSKQKAIRSPCRKVAFVAGGGVQRAALPSENQGPLPRTEPTTVCSRQICTAQQRGRSNNKSAAVNNNNKQRRHYALKETFSDGTAGQVHATHRAQKGPATYGAGMRGGERRMSDWALLRHTPQPGKL